MFYTIFSTIGILTFFAAFVVLYIIAFSVILLKRYKRCPANKVMVITGKTPGGKPRFIQGGAAFIFPIIQEDHYLDLRPITFSIDYGDAQTVDKTNIALRADVTLVV